MGLFSKKPEVHNHYLSRKGEKEMIKAEDKREKKRIKAEDKRERDKIKAENQRETDRLRNERQIELDRLNAERRAQRDLLEAEIRAQKDLLEAKRLAKQDSEERKDAKQYKQSINDIIAKARNLNFHMMEVDDAINEMNTLVALYEQYYCEQKWDNDYSDEEELHKKLTSVVRAQFDMGLRVLNHKASDNAMTSYFNEKAAEWDEQIETRKKILKKRITLIVGGAVIFFVLTFVLLLLHENHII